MIKYITYDITFKEVPERVSLCFGISNCGNHCKGCHSPELQTDVGHELTPDILMEIVNKYKEHVDVVTFLGHGQDYDAFLALLQALVGSGLEVCVYSGLNDVPPSFISYCDYIKTGRYMAKLGGLDSPSTNQRMHHHGRNITYKFRRGL